MADLYKQNQQLRRQLEETVEIDDEKIDLAVHKLGQVIKKEIPITDLTQEQLELIYIVTNY